MYPYWPQKGSPKIEHFIIETQGDPTTYGDYIVREMKITNTEVRNREFLSHFFLWMRTVMVLDATGVSIQNECRRSCDFGLGNVKFTILMAVYAIEQVFVTTISNMQHHFYTRNYKGELRVVRV